MKEKIHPKYYQTTVRCSCGESFASGSTSKELRVEVCSKCHPFYTGIQKIVDTTGQIEKFQKRMAKQTRK